MSQIIVTIIDAENIPPSPFLTSALKKKYNSNTQVLKTIKKKAGFI